MRVSFNFIKRTLDFFFLGIFLFVSISLFYRPSKLFPTIRRTYINAEDLKKEQQTASSRILDDGFHFFENSFTEKFLSYEPPIGSWSKQLLAFQNAVIIAALLNRTLIAQPLISEDHGKRLRSIMRQELKSDSEAYKLIDPKYMVPISSVIDLKILRQLLRVKAIHSTYNDFLKQYSNFTWHNVCHKDSLGFWVDFIPSPANDLAWKILEAQEFVPLKSYFQGVEPVCEQEMEMLDRVENSSPVLRGILTELSVVQEDVIYFRGGSLAARELRFLSKKRTVIVQKWINNYIKFSPYVQDKIHSIVQHMKRPYNAVKLTNSLNLEIMNNTIRFRLKEMEKRKFRHVTNRLYVINEFNETNGLHILERAGYKLYSTMDLVPDGVSRYIKRDVQKLLGELLCKYAWFYEGPLDSYLIQRARVHEARLKDGLLTSLVTVKWAVHTVNRNHRILVDTGDKPKANTPSYHPLLNVWCKLCKTMKKTIRLKACQPILNECIKLHL